MIEMAGLKTVFVKRNARSWSCIDGRPSGASIDVVLVSVVVFVFVFV